MPKRAWIFIIFIFFSCFCFPSPSCSVREWEALLPREWLALGRTPAPLEKQAEKSGKICAASRGEGREGAGRAGDILGLPVSLQLNEHGASMPPAAAGGGLRNSLPCSQAPSTKPPTSACASVSPSGK